MAFDYRQTIIHMPTSWFRWLSLPDFEIGRRVCIHGHSLSIHRSPRWCNLCRCMSLKSDSVWTRLITEAIRQELIDLQLELGDIFSYWYVDPFMGLPIVCPDRIREVEARWRRLLEQETTKSLAKGGSVVPAP